MRTIFLTSCIMVSVFSFAQKSKLAGNVTEQNTGMKIAGAMVKCFGANPIESSNSGYFILTFQDLVPGKNVIVRAEKEGWEVVNEKEMSTLIPNNHDEKPFKIILCKAGTLAKAKSKYYETFELNLQKELDKQKALNKGNAKKIASLEEDFARVQKQLDDLADEYSRIDLSDASEKDLLAIELFKAGKYDEFIKLKNSIVTEAQADKAVQNKKEANNIIANADSTLALYFKSQKDIAKTLLLQFEFEDAEKVYENIVAKDTSNFLNNFELAYFLSNQNKHNKAIFYYLKALNHTKNEAEKALTENNLGYLYDSKNDFTTALNSYEISLAISERLALTDPDNYQPDIAMAHMNLGVLFFRKYNYVKAEGFYLKAIEIYKHFANKNPSRYESYLAKSKTNLGVLYFNKNKQDDAENLFLEAKEILKPLSKINPAKYNPMLADVLVNLGILDYTKNIKSEKNNFLIEAQKIYKLLAEINPYAYEPSLALTTLHLGKLYINENNYIEAEKAFLKSIEIYSKLTNTNPDIYNSYLSTAKSNLGILYRAYQKYLEAERLYLEAIEIDKTLVKENPENWEPDLANVLLNLGVLYMDMNKYSEAEKSYKESLEIFQRFAKINPETFEPRIADILNNQAILYKSINNLSKAETKYKESLIIYRRLAGKNPESYLPAVGRVLNNLGNLFRKVKSYQEAEIVYIQALEIRTNLAENNPKAFNSNLATSKYNLGLLYDEMSKYQLAEDNLLGALKIAKEIYEIAPKINKKLFCNVSISLGSLYLFTFSTDKLKAFQPELIQVLSLMGENNDAEIEIQAKEIGNFFKFQDAYIKIDSLKKVIEIKNDYSIKIKVQEEIISELEKLVSANAMNSLLDLGNNYGNLSWFFILNKQYKDAEIAAKEALFSTKYPKKDYYIEKLEWVNTNLAVALLFQGKYSEAESIYRRLKNKVYKNATFSKAFLADLDDLEKVGITHPDVSKIRTLLKKEIND